MTNYQDEQPASTLPKVAINLPFSISKSWTTTLQISDIEAGFIATKYNTPNGNDPVGNNNNLFVWGSAEVGTGIPWGTQPVATATAAPGGTAVAGQFAAQPYVVGYSVGPSVTPTGKSATYPNIAATAEIPANWDLQKIQYYSPSLSINTIQTQFISFHYSLPQGFNPNSFGSWIGLWTGFVTPYNQPPTATAPITQPTSTGDAAMIGLGLTPRGEYTAALFTSGFSKDPTKLGLTVIATVIEFATGKSLL